MAALIPMEVRTGQGVGDLLRAVAAALDGSGPALLPFAAGAAVPVVATGLAADLAGSAVPDGAALVVGTSGSTGRPKRAVLGADALRASGTATHAALGGPGQWLLALPAHHVAGMQVLFRSVLARSEPVVLDLAGGFTAAGFAVAAGALSGPRRYTALVPTQLTRLLDDPAGREALCTLDAVLVGGAGTPPTLLARARAAGVDAVTTYGMSETAGGCVYDGEPLPVSAIRIEDERLVLGGQTLALGYLGRPDLTAEAFRTDVDGSRWFRTDDTGHQDEQGRWHVDGRLDDLITTGGLKVAPRLVEEAIATQVPEALDCAVVAVPDAEWGQVVAAALVVRDGRVPPSLADLRDRLRAALPGHALPRALLVVDALPTRGPGKTDRIALAERFSETP